MTDGKQEQDSSPDFSRRRFVRDAATVATVACLSPALLMECRSGPGAAISTSAGADAMDEALEMMGNLGPLSNHGPMASEALVTLGQADSVRGFVGAYKKRFTATHPAPLLAVTKENWKAALGEDKRVADWNRFFESELKEAPWPEVVGRWSAVLAPGLAAAAAHGLIRTAHAVRSLTTRDTALRRHELAEGLGYWAAYYQTLPEVQGNNATSLKPAQAISQIPLLPEEKRARGSIMAGLRSLQGFAAFASTADLVKSTGPAEQFLSELTETFATVYVKNVTPRNFIALIHGVTGLTALRSLLPYLSPSATQTALRYGWQVGAGLYSIAGIGSTNVLPANVEIKREYLIERAVASQEEHAIKFTEACLREYALNPKTIYLQAARDALERL